MIASNKRTNNGGCKQPTRAELVEEIISGCECLSDGLLELLACMLSDHLAGQRSPRTRRVASRLGRPELAE
ncbi:MAG TPA: hypothetical protein PKK06_16795 [Phycisphaerae bacterium]|nr:hypothetical protein [Phycisphaerae bacterium]HNU46846.1 hypothetical protein [Phycisphaerae bacterium]